MRLAPSRCSLILVPICCLESMFSSVHSSAVREHPVRGVVHSSLSLSRMLIQDGVSIACPLHLLNILRVFFSFGLALGQNLMLL